MTDGGRGSQHGDDAGHEEAGSGGGLQFRPFAGGCRCYGRPSIVCPIPVHSDSALGNDRSDLKLIIGGSF